MSFETSPGRQTTLSPEWAAFNEQELASQPSFAGLDPQWLPFNEQQVAQSQPDLLGAVPQWARQAVIDREPTSQDLLGMRSGIGDIAGTIGSAASGLYNLPLPGSASEGGPWNYKPATEGFSVSTGPVADASHFLGREFGSGLEAYTRDLLPRANPLGLPSITGNDPGQARAVGEFAGRSILPETLGEAALMGIEGPGALALGRAASPLLRTGVRGSMRGVERAGDALQSATRGLTPPGGGLQAGIPTGGDYVDDFARSLESPRARPEPSGPIPQYASRAELREMARSMNLSDKGSAADLIKRINRANSARGLDSSVGPMDNLLDEMGEGAGSAAAASRRTPPETVDELADSLAPTGRIRATGNPRQRINQALRRTLQQEDGNQQVAAAIRGETPEEFQASAQRALEGIDEVPSQTLPPMQPELGGARVQPTLGAGAAEAGAPPPRGPGLDQLRRERGLRQQSETFPAALGDAPSGTPPRVPDNTQFDLGLLEPQGGGFGTFSEELSALIGAPRTTKASFDLSAPGRQGLALAFRHPVEWLKAWAPMIRSWVNATDAANIAQGVDNMARRWKGKYGIEGPNLYKAGADADALSRVPGFEPQGKGVVANFLRKIPGLERSERAYGTFLNVQKALTFDTMAESLYKAGERNPEAFQRLANIIDHATGFGAAPLKGNVEGTALFSQRYFTSRFQFLTDPIVEGLMKGDLRTARAATENLVAFAGGIAGLLVLLDESGVAEVDFDPRSGDFGKIRIGPQRIDLAAGFLPIIRTAARLATGEAKSTTGDVYNIDKVTEALKFGRYKLAPVPSEGISRIVGENPIGEPNPSLFSVDMARNMFMPLIMDSVIEAMSETGDISMARNAFLGEMFGAGVSTYGSGQAQQADLAPERFSGRDYDDLYSLEQAQLNAEIAAEGKPMGYRERSGAWFQVYEDARTRWLTDLPEELKSNDYVQHATSIDPKLDFEDEMVKWISETYGYDRVDAEKSYDKFMRATAVNGHSYDDYIEAYGEKVLDADPEWFDVWADAYNSRTTDWRPPEWVRDYMKEKAVATP